jgi:hypothetical protein
MNHTKSAKIGAKESTHSETSRSVLVNVLYYCLPYSVPIFVLEVCSA